MKPAISPGDKVVSTVLLSINTIIYFLSYILLGLSEKPFLYLIPFGLVIFQWLAFLIIVAKKYRREFLIPLWFGPFLAVGFINIINLIL